MPSPPNVVRTPELPWEADGAEPPFGPTCREVRPRLPLRDIGLHLESLAPGRRSCPLHDHLLEEEAFYVLSGELEVSERTPDGARRSYTLVAGELVTYPAGTRIAHAFANVGDRPAVFLALSDRRPGDICTYPDSGETLLRSGRRIGVWRGRAPGTVAGPATIAPARVRADVEPVKRLATDERPSHVVRGEERPIGQGDRRFFGTPLSRPGGARSVFVNRDRLPPGCHPSPLHQHAFDEEVLFLLEGALSLRQVADGVETRCRLEPGDLVHWAPGGVAHRIDNEGPDDAVYLVIGTDLPWDVTTFPERGEIYVALLGEVGSIEPRDDREDARRLDPS